MLKYLKPHSPEWFKVLEKTNPQQAAMTLQVISLSGSDDVCSTCGDDPAKDYEVEGATPNTIRLCDDCHEIRQVMHRENLLKSRSSVVQWVLLLSCCQDSRY